MTISLNQGAFIETALRSVVAQDWHDCEYIVVDGGSTDDSVETIGRYADRLAAAIIEADDGPAHGLNKGFARATGEIFGYVNADDALLPGAVAAAVHAFEAHPEADVVYGHGYMMDVSGRPTRRARSDRFDLKRYVRNTVFVMQPATFVRARAFWTAGGFQTSNRTSWDAELLVDLALRGARFVLVDEYWALFRSYPTSISASTHRTRVGRADQERLFARVYGRARRPSDFIGDVVGRLMKWWLDPVGFALRITAAIGLRPSVPRLPSSAR